LRHLFFLALRGEGEYNVAADAARENGGIT
jgi:hypothetical protein